MAYFLDGKEVNPDELKGKSGHLKIQVQYTNNEKKTVTVDGKEEEVYTPFIMMTGMILPNVTFCNVTIELEEPIWENYPDDNVNKIPDEAERMTLNQTIIKDPQVKNTGNNDAFIYMTVEVPCRQIFSVNNDGTRNPLAMRELYNYQVDNSWELLGTVDVSDESGKKVAVKHLYAYAGAQGSCTVVKPQETTKPLFNQVTFINAMEGQ